MGRRGLVALVLVGIIFSLMVVTYLLIHLFFGAGYIMDFPTLLEVSGFLALLYLPVSGGIIALLASVVVFLDEH
jgi:hypothetical protein